MIKKTTALFILILSMYSTLSAQNFNYQAAIRNNTGALIINQSIGVQIKLLQGSALGATVYTETHSVTTNAFGILSLAVGTGATTDTFSSIDWSTNYWLEIATDLTGGTSYTVIGTSQLLSVPQANYALNSPDADPTNEIELPTGGSDEQVLTTDGNGVYSWTNQPQGDNLGNHTATTNIVLGSHYISNDGGDKGISVDVEGAIKTTSSSARPAVFESTSTVATSNLSSYIEVNNPAGTRALFGPDGNGFSGGDKNDVAIANWSEGDLTFFTNAAERMRIDSIGNVGIGKTVPNSKLNVNGKIRVDNGGIDVVAGGVEIQGGGANLVSYAANGTANVRFREEYANAGSINVYNDTGAERYVTFVDTSTDVAATFIYGPNSSNFLVGNLDGSNDNGFVAVADNTGSPDAGMYIDGAGNGIIYGTTKNFRMDHPKDNTKEIWYASLEGPEAGAYARGSATLVNGKAVIELPEHYKETVNEATITLHLTPNSANSKGLAVVGKKASQFQVQELMRGEGNYTFDWVAFGVRKGFENYKVVRDKVKSPKMVNGKKSSAFAMPSAMHDTPRPISELFLQNKYEITTDVTTLKDEDFSKTSIEELRQEVAELKTLVHSLLTNKTKN